jgi:hypothetical protein
VKEEEGQLFPKLKKSDLDQQNMGERLAVRKMALMQHMGLDEDQPDIRTQRRAAAGARLPTSSP